jgi:hypothetical protein
MRKNTAVLLVLALAVTLLLNTELLPYALSQTQNNTSVSAPAIQWQEKYGGSVLYASNLIQTSDGGYVFMDVGWNYYYTLHPATVFKVDSSGSLQWNKTINFFKAYSSLPIIQTNDEGYEIAGQWFFEEHETPTLIKMDSQGKIQWVVNYSSVPELGIRSKAIQTSDGGFVYWWDGSINKTDSNNNTQWVKTLYYKGFEGMKNNTAPLEKLSSVIETSDGALAALGIGLWHLDDARSGSIYLIKTEAFLPLPSQTPLPTPIPTPLPALTVEDAVIMALIIGVVVVAGLLFYFKKRKR